MKAPIVVLTTVVLALAAPPFSGAEQAQPREGGSSGGGSSSSSSGGAVARHPSGGGGSSGGSSVWEKSHFSGNNERRSDSSSSRRSVAERRHPRPGSGRGHHGGYPYPYYPRYSPGYWGYYGYYGYYDWWYGPGWWGYPGYRYHYRYDDVDDNGALRVLVRPSRARVYVDGYYAGLVDDFDGLFQRLNVAPGRHELSFKLEGYKTHRVRLYVPPDQVLKVRYDLVPGEGEDTADDSLDAPGLEWAEQERRRDRGREADRERDRSYRRETPRDRQLEAAPESDEGEPGRISLNVRPEQAAVYVDGAFRGTGRDVADLDLPPGRHRLEVVAPGFKTFEREIDVRAGGTEELRVELERP